MKFKGPNHAVEVFLASSQVASSPKGGNIEVTQGTLPATICGKKRPAVRNGKPLYRKGKRVQAACQSRQFEIVLVDGKPCYRCVRCHKPWRTKPAAVPRGVFGVSSRPGGGPAELAVTLKVLLDRIDDVGIPVYLHWMQSPNWATTAEHANALGWDGRPWTVRKVKTAIERCQGKVAKALRQAGLLEEAA